MIFPGATPALEPRTRASETASVMSATTTWLHALTVCPAPASPTRTTVFPIASKRGFALEKSASSPPTMIESVPSLAPTSAPETGASRTPTPRPVTTRASFQTSS